MSKMKGCARSKSTLPIFVQNTLSFYIISVVVIIGGEKDVRMLLLHSYSLNMTSGDYAFIYPELIEKEAIGNTSWAGGSGEIILTHFMH